MVDAETVNSFKARLDKSIIKYKLNNLMPRIFKHFEAGCLQVNLMSTSAEINQVKNMYTILYIIYINTYIYIYIYIYIYRVPLRYKLAKAN